MGPPLLELARTRRRFHKVLSDNVVAAPVVEDALNGDNKRALLVKSVEETETNPFEDGKDRTNRESEMNILIEETGAAMD